MTDEQRADLRAGGTLIRRVPHMYVEPSEARPAVDIWPESVTGQPGTDARPERKNVDVKLTGVITSVTVTPDRDRPYATLTVSQNLPGESGGPGTPVLRDIETSTQLAKLIQRDPGRFAVNTPVSIVGFARTRQPSEQFPAGRDYVLATKMFPKTGSKRPTA